jgi:hypothetical protein
MFDLTFPENQLSALFGRFRGVFPAKLWKLFTFQKFPTFPLTATLSLGWPFL